MSVSDSDGLLNAILADPADDTPRLALADYLDENDQSVRAEFIRVQVNIAAMKLSGNPGMKLSGNPGHRLKALWERERELWGSFGGPYEIARGFGFPGNWRASLLTENATYAPSNGTAIVRRGFVDEVRMTCAAFCGGPCSQCLRGYVPTDRDDDTCETCHGTSRIPGLAAAIFARHPVTRVVLSDLESEAGARAYWQRLSITEQHWHERIGEPRYRYGVPDAIFDLLTEHYALGGVGGQSGHGLIATKYYPTRQAALDALQCGAAVAYARTLAGLSPLAVNGPV